MVYHCTGCDSFTLQPLGVLKQTEKHLKFALPSAPPVTNKCEHCGHSHHASLIFFFVKKAVELFIDF